MENENKQKELSSSIIEKIKEIYSKFPKEVNSNSMTTIQKVNKIFWRPNNYRRQITVKEKDNSTIKKIKVLLGKNPHPHTKIISIKNYLPNITIQYAKNTLTGIYSQNMIGGHKEIYKIEAYSIDDIEERIDSKKQEIKNKIDKALKIFSRKFGISMPLTQPIWSRYEDFIKGEEYIDKIPSEIIIHDTFFKKVYGKGIEFKNAEKSDEPTVHMKNYIKNRAIENISPQLAEELRFSREIMNNILYSNKLIMDRTEDTSKVVHKFGKQIELHLEVLQGIKKAFNTFNKKLEQKNLKEWM